MTLFENLSGHGSLIRVQHLSEIRCGFLVDFKNLLPFFFPLLRLSTPPVCSGIEIPHFSATIRTASGKRHVLDQLDKLENISARLQPKQMKELFDRVKH